MSQIPALDTAAGGETSSKAIASLVISILSLISCCGGIFGIVGIVLGNSAQKEIVASDGQIQGEGLAKAGVIIGWIAIALFVVWILLSIINGGLYWYTAAAAGGEQTLPPTTP